MGLRGFFGTRFPDRNQHLPSTHSLVGVILLGN